MIKFYPFPSQVHPHTALKWRRCKDLPVGMNQHCSVLYLGKVCVGGGYTGSPKDQYLVFQYDHLKDSWDALPACSVMLFALAQFQGCLITLGGIAAGEVTEKVYSYNEEAREWVEFLKPMSVARYGPSVITTQSAIIACGGRGRKIVSSKLVVKFQFLHLVITVIIGVVTICKCLMQNGMTVYFPAHYSTVWRSRCTPLRLVGGFQLTPYPVPIFTWWLSPSVTPATYLEGTELTIVLQPFSTFKFQP